MEIDMKVALEGIQSLEAVARMLRDVPELQPLAKRMLGDIMNGGGSVAADVVEGPVKRGRAYTPMTAERKRALSIAAKKRWKLAKKAGKNTIGGGR